MKQDLLNKIIFSKDTKKIIDDNFGYRIDEYNLSKPRKLEDVVKFEIDELWNEDILDFVNNNYAGSDQLKTSNDIINYLYGFTSAKQLYCIWLATADNAKKIYYVDDNTAYYMSKYCLDQFDFIISDLGPDGALFVSEKCPKPQSMMSNKNIMEEFSYEKEYILDFGSSRSINK